MAREAEAQRLAAEAERQRLEQERLQREEAERLAREAEAQRLAAEAERQRLEQESLDLEPLAEDVVSVESLNEAVAPSSHAIKSKPSWLNKPIDDLLLSIRASNALHYGGFRTVSDLAGKSENDLLQIRNFGAKSLAELKQSLARDGIPFPVPGVQQAEEPGEPAEGSRGERRKFLATPATLLRDLGIPQSALGPLLRHGLHTLGDLGGKTEADLEGIRYLGTSGIQRIRQALANIGLGLPFVSSDLDQPDLRANTQRPENLQSGGDRKKQREDAIACVSEAAKRCMAGEIVGPEEAIEALLQNTQLTRGHVSLHAELSILTERLRVIQTLLGPPLSNESNQALAWTEIKKAIFVRYAHELSDDTSKSWLNSLQKSIARDGTRGWSSYISRVCGATYQAIGDQLDPPLTRERIRQLINRVASVIGAGTDTISERINTSTNEQANAKQGQAIKTWLDRLGRLPFKGDQPHPADDMELWNTALALNPKQRLETYDKFAIPVPDAEWDVHYDWICNSSLPMGNCYWKDFECLKQFLLRHAITLGHPNAMPKQTSLPRRVGGIVQGFGGQSKVARRIGLRYQGQLVGEDGGRTYWTEEKLIKLLEDVNRFFNQDLSMMPSQSQIYGFFKEQVDEPYVGKNPGSPIANMNQQGKLHWSEVASRYGKNYIAGASTANVTLAYIKAFVRDLGEHLEALTPSELYVLFQAQGIYRGEKEKFSRTFDRLVDAVQSGMVKRDDLLAWAQNHEVESINELLDLGVDLKAESGQAAKELLLLQQRSKQLKREFKNENQSNLISSNDLPQLDPVKTLLALDKAASVIESSATDADRVEFLKAKATAKLWDACFADEDKLIDRLRSITVEEDTYSSEVRASFLEEYEGARSLKIPSSYQFRDLKGQSRRPKLMQRLVAYRLKRDYRLLNLSGTGTGKTLSAILAAQVCGCRRILVTCPNGVITSWQRTLSSAYPDAVVHVKPENWELPELDEGTHVVVINHERFQNQFRQPMLEFCLGFQADLIVIDEIHQAKQRDHDKSSQRRRLMDQFVFTSGNLNSELRVLGLSATPVINNLQEGRSLIELVSQEVLDDVDKDMDLNACMNLYQHFVVHGIRMNHGHLPRTEIVLADVDATSLLPQVISATRGGSHHEVEQLLVQPKLSQLKTLLEPGQKTVIFITYIKGTLEPLCHWLESNSYRFSVYTGSSKEAQQAGFVDSLDEFIRGSTDILVASIQCAGTGVDGLQSVCNRAVFLQLPWTSTEFEQAIGRLDRDGTEFESIKVFLPITDIHLPSGERWSWCRSKLDRIESKRDIAKAAVDGDIPDAATLITPSEASKYWLRWLEKLDQESHGD